LTRRGIFLALWLCLAAVPLSAGQKVYEGDEAAALRCANTLAFTAVALAETGRLGEPEKSVMLQITVLILERHVSGTWAQKKAALRVVRDRRDMMETLEDFERNAQRCFEQFPIN
jgi:hypothetical protein